MNLYEKLVKELSLDNIYENMKYLVEEVGERLSGTKEMKKATDYLWFHTAGVWNRRLHRSLPNVSELSW